MDLTQFQFRVLDWAAYADGCTSKSDWIYWASLLATAPNRLVHDVPELTEMSPMLRRRVSRIGRLACQVAYWCQNNTNDVPLVFASRYGDAGRSLALLGELIHDRPVSPNGFSLSVHNAISGLYSMATAQHQNIIAVAAGRATTVAALIEAAGLLFDGHPEVLIVHYEAPLPDAYSEFQDETACEYAWAWRLALSTGDECGNKRITMALNPNNEENERMGRMPLGLQLQRLIAMNSTIAQKNRVIYSPQDQVGTSWSWTIND